MSSQAQKEARNYSEMSLGELSERDRAVQEEMRRLDEELSVRFQAATNATDHLINSVGSGLVERVAKLPVSAFGALTRTQLLEPALADQSIDPQVTMVFRQSHLSRNRYNIQLELSQPPEMINHIEIGLSPNIGGVLWLRIDSDENPRDFLWSNDKNTFGYISTTEGTLARAINLGTALTQQSLFDQLALYHELLDTFSQYETSPKQQPVKPQS